MDNVTLLY